MEQLRNGQPGPHETWDELADHSLDHDDLGSPIVLAARYGPLLVDVSSKPGLVVMRTPDGWPLPRYRQRGEDGW
jgi:hypothetical protein